MKYSRNRFLIPVYFIIKILLIVYILDLNPISLEYLEDGVSYLVLYIIFLAVLIASIVRLSYLAFILKPKIFQILIVLMIFVLFWKMMEGHMGMDDYYMKYVMRHIDFGSYLLKEYFIYTTIYFLILEPFSLRFFEKKKGRILDNSLLDEGVIDEE